MKIIKLYRIRILRGNGHFDVYVVGKNADEALEKIKAEFPRSVLLAPDELGNVYV